MGENGGDTKEKSSITIERHLVGVALARDLDSTRSLYPLVKLKMRGPVTSELHGVCGTIWATMA